jgi:hypothetical protein
MEVVGAIRLPKNSPENFVEFVAGQ